MARSLRRIPLAWRNLSYQPIRLFLAIAGITFAVFLMFMQYGFLNALFDSTVVLFRNLDGELIITHRLKTHLPMPQDFSHRRIYQAQGVDGVARVTPVYIETVASEWTDQSSPLDERNVRWIRMIGIEPDNHPLLMAGLGHRIDALKRPDRVLVDAQSRPFYGTLGEGTNAELTGNDVEIIGNFQLGTDFATQGTVIVSTERFASTLRDPYLFPEPLDHVDLGVVKLRADADPQVVQQQLQSILPADVQIQSIDEMIEQEKRYWQQATPVGFAFTFGMVMGFLVGLIICYQILSTDVSDHLPEYATLKAMGYSNAYLRGVVLQQGILLSLIGFVPGLIVSALTYAYLSARTGLPMDLWQWQRIGLVFVLTVGMCVVSGLIALRRVEQADPAEGFR